MVSLTFSWTEAYAVLKPLGLFVAGMVIYAVFVFHFYKFLARRDIFQLNLRQYNTSSHPFLEKFLGVIFYIVEYIILFPIFIVFWGAILTVLITFLAQDPVLGNIMIASLALVASVRVCAYYNQDLSVDLAKMLPFALLGIFLIDNAAIDFLGSVQILLGLPTLLQNLVYYLIFVIALEFILRIIHGIFGSEDNVSE